MSTEQTSSKPRRTARDVQQEIVLGLQRLDLSNDIDPGHVVAVGGYADVYCGTLVVKKTNRSVKVAAKKIKCMLEKEKDFAKVRSRPPLGRPNGCVNFSDDYACSHLRENFAYGQAYST